MNFTNQELFDKAYKAIIAQGEPSLRGTDDGRGCAYRGDNGTSCAIGHLLSPELRATIYEGGIMSRLYDVDPTVRHFFGISLKDLDAKEGDPVVRAHAKFLSQLQRAHDTAALPDEVEADREFYAAPSAPSDLDFIPAFKSYMAQLAKTYNLTVPEV